MCFIAIKQVCFSLLAHLFEFCEFLCLKFTAFRKRFSFGTFPYAFISSAKLFKKALKVLSLTLLPLLDSHSALRPQPGLVNKPDSPSFLYRFNQLFTLIWHMPVIDLSLSSCGLPILAVYSVSAYENCGLFLFLTHYATWWLEQGYLLVP
jgi:hypothetical protein